MIPTPPLPTPPLPLPPLVEIVGVAEMLPGRVASEGEVRFAISAVAPDRPGLLAEVLRTFAEPRDSNDLQYSVDGSVTSAGEGLAIFNFVAAPYRNAQFVELDQDETDRAQRQLLDQLRQAIHSDDSTRNIEPDVRVDIHNTEPSLLYAQTALTEVHFWHHSGNWSTDLPVLLDDVTKELERFDLPIVYAYGPRLDLRGRMLRLGYAYPLSWFQDARVFGAMERAALRHGWGFEQVGSPIHQQSTSPQAPMPSVSTASFARRIERARVGLVRHRLGLGLGRTDMRIHRLSMAALHGDTILAVAADSKTANHLGNAQTVRLESDEKAAPSLWLAWRTQDRAGIAHKLVTFLDDRFKDEFGGALNIEYAITRSLATDAACAGKMRIGADIEFDPSQLDLSALAKELAAHLTRVSPGWQPDQGIGLGEPIYLSLEEPRDTPWADLVLAVGT